MKTLMLKWSTLNAEVKSPQCWSGIFLCGMKTPEAENKSLHAELKSLLSAEVTSPHAEVKSPLHLIEVPLMVK